MKTTMIVYSLLGSVALSAVAGGEPPKTSATVRGPEILSRVINVSPKTNHLGQALTITVSDLNNLTANAYTYQKEILLFVDGRELAGVSPIGMDLGSNTLRFLLKRTPANKDVWTSLLRDPIPEPIRPISFSVGLRGDSPLLVEAGARNTWLYVIGWNWWTTLWLIVFSILILIFLLLTTFSDILRDPVPDSTGRRPFSLSRTQAAFWLFITAMSFVFILVTTGDLATLNASVLALIGISTGTLVASSLLEGAKSTTAAATPTTAPPPPAGSVTARALLVISKIESIPFFGRFLGDILSDEDGGVSVPRFQIFVWTIILGIVFVSGVLKELSMPEFNATLLALMGISSATYVGSKMAN